MDDKAKARDLPERAGETWRQRECSDGYTPEGWPDPLAEPCALAQDELDLRQSHVVGHHWDPWRRLTGDEDYVAACSCGWRSTETGNVSAVLRQVKDHLDAVQEARGGLSSAYAAAADEHGRNPSRGEMQPHERARELRASVEGQQMRLSQSLTRSTDLLSACASQLDRLVAALECRQWAPSTASAPSAGNAQRMVERAGELRKAIAAAAVTLAATAEEIAWIHRDLETRHPAGSAGNRRMIGIASETAGTAREPERTSSR